MAEETAFRLNQGGEAVWSEAEAGKTEGLILKPGARQGQEVSRDSNNNKGPWTFQGKKGSLFPVKRKLVKTLMVECLAKSLSSVSISPEEASLSSKVGGSSTMLSATDPSKFKSSKGKKRMEISVDHL